MTQDKITEEHIQIFMFKTDDFLPYFLGAVHCWFIEYTYHLQFMQAYNHRQCIDRKNLTKAFQ